MPPAAGVRGQSGAWDRPKRYLAFRMASWSVMNLLQLIRSFTRTAETGSIAAAARTLGISATAVGQNINRLEAHLGNYSDWRRRVHESKRVETQAAPPAAKAPAKPPSAAAVSRETDKDRERERRRLARRVETLEADVSKLEGELASVRAELASDHGGDWQKLHTLADRERELDALLTRRMAEWEAASAAVLNQSSTSSD